MRGEIARRCLSNDMLPFEKLMPYRPLHVIARSNATKQSSFLFRGAKAGLLPPSLFELRRTSRLARNDVEGVAPTRWLAMTWRGSRRNDEPVARMDQSEILG